MDEKIVLFDGVCNLCSGAVQFIVRHDRKQQFKFSSLQSEVGKELLKQYQLDSDYLHSLVFIDNGKIYTKSSGALRIAKYLDGGWPLLYVFMIFPRFIRDAVYQWVAQNRYRWFGKKKECWMPTPALRARFLE